VPGVADAADQALLCRRFEFPTARVALGQQLAGVASACIDISDGVYVDLGRLAEASGCGAWLEVAQLPLSAALQQALGKAAWQYALQGGEDYELGIAVPAARLPRLQALAASCDTPLCCVGELRHQPGIGLRNDAGELSWRPAAFDHFPLD
jgi:thiamine-monophosphate kinase